MEVYHKAEKLSMKIFPSQSIARVNRKQGEVTVPFGSLHGVQRWANMACADYIEARNFVSYAH